MSKENKHCPKDIEELMDITYGTDYDKKKKYNDVILSDVHSPIRESQVIGSVNHSLNIEKIPERKGIKTPDFKIESESLFIEVTSLNTPPIIGERINPSEWDIPRKLSEAVNHMEEKDRLDHNDFLIGGVIFVEFKLYMFKSDIMKEESLVKYIRDSTFLNSNVDFLYIRADSASINGESSEKLYPPFIFVKKEEMKDKIHRIFPVVDNVILLQKTRFT